MTAKGRATRDRIIVATAELVRERGLSNTYLEHVHAAAGVSNSQLFHYFPDGRAELLYAVAEYEADQILAEQEPELSDLTSPESWSAWASKVLQHYRAQGPNCGLSALVGQLDPGDPRVVDIISELYRRWQDRLAAGVAALQTTGIASSELVPADEAAVLLAGIQGGVLMMGTTGTADHIARVLDQALVRLSVSRDPQVVDA